MVTQIKERTTKAQASSQRTTAKPFGLSYAELIAATVVLLTIVGALIFFFTTLRPAQVEIKELQKQLDVLTKAEAEVSSQIQKKPEATVDTGKEALDSLENFKSSSLKPLTIGRIALINDINALAKKHNVQLTSGLDMNLDRADSQTEDDKNAATKQKSNKLLSVFPNLKIRFTVAGEYAKLRSFISELEANRQFITIDSLNLAAIKDTDGSKSKRRSVLTGIGLSVEMTAFFYPQTGK
jgi:hypothetical protein